jgi:hypothetical protein
MTSNKNIAALELAKELLWWCISTLIAFMAMYPIFSIVHYTMIWMNGLIILVALTYFRYAVMLRTVYVLRSKWVKAVLLLFNINFFVFVLRQEQRFMTIYDSYTIDELGKPIRPISLEQVDQLIRYFFNEINFSVVFCLAMIVALSVRIVLTYWKTAYLRLNAGTEE